MRDRLKEKRRIVKKLVENLKEPEEEKSFVIKNVSGIDIVIEDLGIPLQRDDIVKLTHYVDRKEISKSYDLRNLINEGHIVVLIYDWLDE